MLLLCVFINFLATLVAGQSIVTSPRNTAAETGTSARLNCTVNLGNDELEWRHYPNSPTGTRIVISSDPTNIPDSKFDLDYDVDQGSYDLIINSVTNDLAGHYLCHLLHSNEMGEANIVSLSSLDCDTLGDISNVTVGTTLSLTCAVSYTGYKHPRLKWYSEETVISGEYDQPPDTTNTLLYTARVTIEDDHIGTPFHCELDFEPEPGDTEPVYTDYCSITFGDSPDGSTWPSTGSGSRPQCSLLLVGVLVLIFTLRRTVQFGYL